MNYRMIVLFGCMAFALAAAGCKQQQGQWNSGSGGQQPAGQENQVMYPPSSVKNPEEVRNLETLAKANPNNADAWIALGNAQMDSQRFAEAIVAYQRAVELKPKDTNVLVDLGTCYRGVGQPEKAVEMYQKALKVDPNHLNGLMNSGVVYEYDLNKPKEAIKYFEKYLQVVPNAPNAEQIKGEVQKLKAMK
ncbi:MAG: tetratricopeptide repeat protein [Nitrospiraceae bacterium]|nr:tetratricopeptide repeat protein [Nitrospiraceae bacterium]